MSYSAYFEIFKKASSNCFQIYIHMSCGSTLLTWYAYVYIHLHFVLEKLKSVLQTLEVFQRWPSHYWVKSEINTLFYNSAKHLGVE